MNTLLKEIQVEEAYFQDDLVIPDLTGMSLKIFDKKIKKKSEACYYILKLIHSGLVKSKSNY